MSQGTLKFDATADHANGDSAEPSLDNVRVVRPTTVDRHNTQMCDRDRRAKKKRQGPPSGKLCLAERFERFHKANPHIYHLLCAYAREWKAQGYTRCSINMLFEHLRYECAIARPQGEKFRLNNNLRAHYARRIMRDEADLKDFFEIRELAA